MPSSWNIVLATCILGFAVRAVAQNDTSAPSIGPSTLKVAACLPGQVPFVSKDDTGKLAGYDLDMWQQVYDAMATRLANAGDDPALNGSITPDIIAMVGDSPPPIMNMTSERIQKELAAGTIDVGLCGYFVTPARMQQFDFSPPYLFSGLQASIRAGDEAPTVLFVISALVATVDYTGQLILLILVIGVVVFGHLVAAAENLKLSSREEFRDNYFEGTQDGMWFSIVVMSTVGFGDIAPRTTGGRFLTIIWIFISVALMAMLLGIVTSNFGKLVLVQTRPESSIVTQADLLPYRVGSASAYAVSVLRRNPNQTVVAFPTNAQAVAFSALLNGTVDVIVDRPETIQYYSSMDPDFEGKIRAVGSTFGQTPVAFGMRTANAVTPHPLRRLLSLAVADATRGERSWQVAADTYTKWFGGGVVAEDSEAKAELQMSAIITVRQQTAYALIILFIVWMFGGFLLAWLRLPFAQANNHLCEAVRSAAGITEVSSEHLTRHQALTGLAKLVESWGDGSGGGGGGGNVDAAAGGGSEAVRVDAALVRAGSEKSAGGGGGSKGRGSPVAPGVVLVPVRKFIQHVSATLSREHPRTRWYHRITLRNYPRWGEGMVRDAFFRSCKASESELEDPEPITEDSDITLDTLAAVVVDIVSWDAPGLFQEGGLLFPFRTIDSDKVTADRGFEHLSRMISRLGAQVAATTARLEAVEGRFGGAAGGPPGGAHAGVGGAAEGWAQKENGGGGGQGPAAAAAALADEYGHGPGRVFARSPQPRDAASPVPVGEREVWYGMV